MLNAKSQSRKDAEGAKGWNDLHKKSDELPSPEWHKDVLEAREDRVRSGLANFKNWDEVKWSLRERFK